MENVWFATRTSAQQLWCESATNVTMEPIKIDALYATVLEPQMLTIARNVFNCKKIEMGVQRSVRKDQFYERKKYGFAKKTWSRIWLCPSKSKGIWLVVFLLYFNDSLMQIIHNTKKITKKWLFMNFIKNWKKRTFEVILRYFPEPVYNTWVFRVFKFVHWWLSNNQKSETHSVIFGWIDSLGTV